MWETKRRGGKTNGRMGNQPTDERKGCENLVGLYKPYGTDEHESSGRELGGPESLVALF